MLLSSLGTSVAHVALPTLVRELGASFAEVQWVVLAYLLAITATIVGVGRLGDVLGRRRVLLGGLALYALGSLACSAAPSLHVLVAARGAAGLGAAAMMSLTVAFVGELVPREQTGRAMGLLGTMSAVGTALGPSVGGALVALAGWRAIFFVPAPLAVLAMVLAQRALPRDSRERGAVRGALDVTGTLLLALTLAAYALSMTLGRSGSGALRAGLLAAALAGAGAFALVESRAVRPLVRVAMFRDRRLTASLAASALVATVLMATLVVGPFHLSVGLGLDVGSVGLVMSSGPLVAALSGVPAGRLVDSLGPERTTVMGLSGALFGALLLALVPERAGALGFVVPIMLLTGGYAVFQAANQTTVMRGASADGRGVISALLNLSRNLGLITGASVMGAVFTRASGAADVMTASAEDVASATRTTFALAAGLVAIALVITQKGRAIAPGALVLGLALASWSPRAAAQPVPADDVGLALRSDDGAHSVRVMGLLQLQYAHEWSDGAPDGGTFLVSRARVGLVGSAFTRDLRYVLVAELGRGAPQLLFAHVDYMLVPGWLTLRVGRFKRPFSRSFITMAGQLSTIDRPMTVGPLAFGDDVDLGVMAHDGFAGPLEYAIGVFGGGGAAGLPERAHPLLVARVGYLTEGASGYVEGDLAGGAPRFGVAVAGIADFDADGDGESFVSGVVDVLLAAHGFALTSALYVGGRQGAAEWSSQRLWAVGHHTQLSYVVGGVLEPVARYAVVLPEGDGEARHELTGGVNVYFRGHALKLQTFVTARLASGSDDEVRLQSQLGVAL